MLSNPGADRLPTSFPIRHLYISWGIFAVQPVPTSRLAGRLHIKWGIFAMQLVPTSHLADNVSNINRESKGYICSTNLHFKKEKIMVEDT
jgi:hypothetical protein